MPRSHKNQHAARTIKNGMAAGRAGQDRLSDELPARTPVVLRYSIKEIEKSVSIAFDFAGAGFSPAIGRLME